MRCLARLMRCAMVASGTRNARAISAVVRPPTARSVSATWEGGGQRRVAAQEQQGQRVVVRPGRRPVAGGGVVGGSSAATVTSRRRRALLAAPLVDQPRERDGDQPGRAGCPGRPAPATAAAAASSASCTASSQASNCPYRRTSAPRTCGASSRSRSSTSGWTSHLQPGARPSPAAPRRPGTGPRACIAASSTRPLDARAVHQVVAGQVLLGLQVRPVGHRRHAVAHPHRAAVRRVGQRGEADQLAGLAQPAPGTARARTSARPARPATARRGRPGCCG